MAKTRVPVIAGFKDFAASVFGEIIDKRPELYGRWPNRGEHECNSEDLANFCFDCVRRWLEDDAGIEELCRLLNMRNADDKSVAQYLGNGNFYMSTNPETRKDLAFHTKEHYDAAYSFKETKSRV